MAEKSPIRKTDGISKQEKTVAALVKQEKRHFLKWIKSEFYPLIRNFQQKGKKGDFPSIEKYYRNGKSSRNPSKKEKRSPLFCYEAESFTTKKSYRAFARYDSSFDLVRLVGLEPTRDCSHQPLKLTRLPFRHNRVHQIKLVRPRGIEPPRGCPH